MQRERGHFPKALRTTCCLLAQCFVLTVDFTLICYRFPEKQTINRLLTSELKNKDRSIWKLRSHMLWIPHQSYKKSKQHIFTSFFANTLAVQHVHITYLEENSLSFEEIPSLSIKARWPQVRSQLSVTSEEKIKPPTLRQKTLCPHCQRSISC